MEVGLQINAILQHTATHATRCNMMQHCCTDMHLVDISKSLFVFLFVCLFVCY